MKCPKCSGSGEVVLDSARSSGEYLGLVRKSLGLTLKKVNAATGISMPHLSELENGKISNPGFKIIKELCNLYNISIDDVMSEVPPKLPTE